MSYYRTVIIGMGRMGRTRLLAMNKHEGFHVVAVCDSNQEAMRDFECHKYSDFRQCIDIEHPDVVFVCTINSVTVDVVCYSLENGCHVFSEKPPGRNLDDALRMQYTYEKCAGKVLKFGFNHRYHNSIIEARSLVDSGFLGEIVAARGVYGKAGNFNIKEWRNDIKLSGGGILIDQGIHMLDLLMYFLGDFNQVFGFTDNLMWKGTLEEDTAFATLKTRDGKIATLHSSAIQWKHKFDLDLILTNGYIALNGLLTSTNSYGEETITYYKKDLDGKSGKIGNPTEYTMCFDEDYSWDYEISEFYDAIDKGTPVINGTIEDAVKVMQLVERIYNIDKSGGKLNGND